MNAARAAWLLGVGCAGLGAMPVSALAQGVTLRGGAGAVRLAGPSDVVLQGPCDDRSDLKPGEYAVHFAPDADGRGKPLRVALAAGDWLQLAKAPAGPLPVTEVALTGDAWTRHDAAADEWAVRTVAGDGATAQQITATVSLTETTQAVGVVARWRTPLHWTRFVVDRAAGEFRIETCRGQRVLTMARAKANAFAVGPHRLTLQITGFRCEAFCDDIAVLHCMDGGSAPGSIGLCHRGDAPTWLSLSTAEPSDAATTVALVQLRDGARLHAATTLSPGMTHVLELALDRPHPVVFAPNGVESTLLLPPAAPQVVVLDWANTDVVGATGSLPASGEVTLQLALPRPGSEPFSALVRLLFVPRGELVYAATPAVPLQF